MDRIYKLAMDINKIALLCGGNTVNSITKYCETITIGLLVQKSLHYSPDFRKKIIELILDKKTTSTQLYKNLKISKNNFIYN